MSNFGTEEEVLAMMREVVAKTAELSKETEEEAAWPAARRAWLRYCIGDVEGARLLLDRSTLGEHALVRARIERWEGDANAARIALEAGTAIEKSDRAVEIGHIELLAGNFAKALTAFESIPFDYQRRSEVDYWRGVALFHLGLIDAARATWLSAVVRFGEDRWMYRADWALEGSARGSSSGQRFFSSRGKKSALGRHGYMGRRNPDLEASAKNK